MPKGSSLNPGDAAYQVLNERITANQANFYVYQDGDAGFNHGFPSGFFGTISKITLDAFCINDLIADNGCSTDDSVLDRERGNVLRISFDALGAGQFAGVNIEEPENWGANPRGMGYDLRGATQVVLEARSPTPGGISVQFGVHGATSNFIHIPQSNTFSTLTITFASLGLTQPELADVHLLFSIVTNDNNAPAGGTLLLDNIRFEPVPTSQQDVVGFPLSTETFGVIPLQNVAPGRVPIPSDQVLRNLTTIYESSLTLMALLERGTADDLDKARLIADAFVYALGHDNQGLPLPPAPDGSVGLHSGYESGALALFNGQGPGAGQQGDVRLAGFSASTALCGSSGFCLLLDGATGGNNAFVILALAYAYQQFKDTHPGDAIQYLDGARTIAQWIFGNLLDDTGTGYGGYYLGYPDQGAPKILLKGKSIENVADIYSAFMALAVLERDLGNDMDAAEWEARATIAGDFVMEMFDSATGCFYAGTVPVGTPAGPGLDPSGPSQGDDVVNTFDFLDANTFTTLALAAAPGYRDQIDWQRPVQCMLDHFALSITVGGQTFEGFNLVENPTAGPDGIAWEFAGQAVVTMRFVDHLYQESGFEAEAAFYLGQIWQAQSSAPFGDEKGLVASTLQDGDTLPPLEQCLSTPFQCIPQRVGLAATTWAIFADQDINPLGSLSPVQVISPDGGETWVKGSSQTITWLDTISENVKIELLKSGAVVETIASSTPSDGSRLWVVSLGLAAGSDYKVKITSVDDGSASDTSNGDFTIAEPDPVTRYVSTTGNDTGNDCTNPLSPCATIAHAVSQANNGDTLDVAAGTYNEPSLIIEKNLLIQGQGVLVQ